MALYAHNFNYNVLYDYISMDAPENIQFDDPKFDSEKFSSKLTCNGKSIVNNFKMKIKEINDNDIILEFLSNHPDEYDFFYNLEKKVVDVVYKNGLMWFNGNVTYDNIKQMHRPLLQLPTHIKEKPYIILPFNSNIKIVDKNNEMIDKSDMKVNYEVIATIDIPCVSFERDYYMLMICLSSLSIIDYYVEMSNYLFYNSMESYDEETEIDIVTSIKTPY